jgi:hypothetical protein
MNSVRSGTVVLTYEQETQMVYKPGETLVIDIETMLKPKIGQLFEVTTKEGQEVVARLQSVGPEVLCSR